MLTAVICLSAVFIALTLCCLYVVIRWRAQVPIKVASPRMLVLMLVGSLTFLAAPLAAALIPGDARSRCVVPYALAAVGFDLLFAPLLLNTWRLVRLFNDRGT